MDNVSKEKAADLWNELIEYEKQHTEITSEERTALHEWVIAGNSVYENSSMATSESGKPCDFLEVYRYEEEIRQTLKKLPKREQDNYLARLRGEDTIDNLHKDLSEVLFSMRIYEQILRNNGLLEEANVQIEQAKEESRKHALQFAEWRLSHPDVELPFNQEEFICQK